MSPSQNADSDQSRVTITVNGLLSTPEFQKAKCCAEV